MNSHSSNDIDPISANDIFVTKNSFLIRMNHKDFLYFDLINMVSIIYQLTVWLQGYAYLRRKGDKFELFELFWLFF